MQTFTVPPPVEEAHDDPNGTASSGTARGFSWQKESEPDFASWPSDFLITDLDDSLILVLSL